MKVQKWETTVWMFVSNKRRLCLGVIPPALVCSSARFWKQSVKQETDSQVLQRVQAGERLLGHRSDLVPLQESGERTDSERISYSLLSSFLFMCTFKVEESSTHSLFSLSRAEKGPFMSSMVQEISLFWRSLFSEQTKTNHTVKKKRVHTQRNNRAGDVNKTLCSLCKGGKYLRL